MAAQNRGDRAKICRRQHAALQCCLQARLRPVRFRQGRGAHVFHYTPRGGGFLHSGAAKTLVQCRFRILQNPACGLGDSHFLQLFNDVIKTK